MTRILLIEDEQDVRETTAEILELANFEVITAENGKIGVDLAREKKPDLIICDIMMPVMDGYEVLYMLGKNPATSTIPFIFLSAKSEKGDVRHGMNLGADDYLTKPFEEMELLNAVDTRIAKKEVFQSAYQPTPDDLDNFINHARGAAKLKELSENRASKVFVKKQTLFHEGEHPYFLYFIKSGKIKTYKSNSFGKDFVSGVYSAGDFLGHIALLRETPYSQSAEVIEDAEIIQIPKEEFMALFRKDRDVAARFIKLLAGNVVEQEQELLRLAYDSVRKRAAVVLVDLYDKYKDSETGKAEIEISREDLAGMVGTAKESLIRTLSGFKEDGYLDIVKKRILIEDPTRLKQVKF